MDILTYPLGELRANCYLVIQNDKCIIIDPADSAYFILESIQRKNLKLIAMLATHGHFDHVMAVGEVQLSFRVPLYIFEEDIFLLKRTNETAKFFLGHDSHVIEPQIILKLKEGKNIIDGFEFETIKTPGHTPGGCCFFMKKEGIIFTGDTLFKDGIGRYDFSYSNKKDLDLSLKKLCNLPEETSVYPGHGVSTTIGEEKKELGIM